MLKMASDPPQEGYRPASKAEAWECVGAIPAYSLDARGGIAARPLPTQSRKLNREVAEWWPIFF